MGEQFVSALTGALIPVLAGLVWLSRELATLRADIEWLKAHALNRRGQHEQDLH